MTESQYSKVTKNGLLYFLSSPHPYIFSPGEVTSYMLDWTSPNSTNYHFVFVDRSWNNVTVTCNFWTQSAYAISTPAASTSQATMQASTTAVTPSASMSATSPLLQMPQPPQQTAAPSTINTPQLVLAIAVITAVVIATAFLYSRRKGQTVKTAEKVDTSVAPSSTQAAEGKRFCIECGDKLPPNLKFCDSCGTKQP